jgi:P pilus assembly chaperone PapD
MTAGARIVDAGRALRCAVRRRRIPALCALLALLSPALNAEAQLAVNRVEVVMHTNDLFTRDVVIGVRNESGKPVQALVRLEDWDRSADGSNQWYPYGTRAGGGSCGKALSIFPQSMRLDAGASQSVRVVLDSEYAPTGECWAAAVVETVQPAERQGQRVAYVLRTAVKIYVQPPGLRADGEIAGIRLVADSSEKGKPAPGIEVAFANTGSRHVVAEGVLEVRRPDNAIVTRVPLPNVYALPGARQAVRVPMPDLPPGNYVFLATMDYGGPDIAAALLEHRKR